MAIIDKNKKPYIADEDENVFIGLNLPIHRSNGPSGFFDASVTTIEAVKNNIKNLLYTHQGERIMQPRLGIDLRRYLFEQYTDDIRLEIETEITEIVGYWLPFVQIRKLDIQMDDQYDVGTNTLKIEILFNITRDPNTLASVQLAIDSTVLGGGGF
tara:strand:- start:2553 stop:3020 length:468 start_codon:yes stop_codon:yes gene_type:complete